jgi:predicted DNA-binding transcriptional regulator YafY
MPDQKAQATFQRRMLVLEAIRTLSCGSTANDSLWVKAADIVAHLAHKGYPVEKHNVLRDLKALQDTYHQLDRNDNARDGKPKRGEAYGYRWCGIDPPPDGGLTIPEALSVALVERYLKQALPATLVKAFDSIFRQAESTLALHKKSPEARWLETICVVEPAQPLKAPVLDAEVLRIVHEALLSSECIEAVHRSPSGEGRTFTLHPQGLLQRGSTTYLVATAFDYDDLRFYALHRIDNAKRLYEPAKRSNTDIAAYATNQAHFGSGDTIRLRASVNSDLALILEETPLDENQQLSLPDDVGLRTLTAEVRDTWQLRWWILSQGDGIEVVEPIALRSEIRSVLARALEHYSPEQE